MVYFDDHLTSEYARALAPAVGALADRTLFSAIAQSQAPVPRSGALMSPVAGVPLASP